MILSQVVVADGVLPEVVSVALRWKLGPLV